MSANSLSNIHRRLGKVATRRHAEKPKRSHNWRMLLILPLWVAVAFILSNIIVVALMTILSWMKMPVESFLLPAVEQTVVAVFIYIITIAIAIGVPYSKSKMTNRTELGLTRLPSWTDIGLAPVGFIVYILMISTVLAIVTSWMPYFPLDQAQKIGFKAFGSQSDNILAFLTLVVVAPFAEELLFRGYLYGKLKNYVPAIVAAIATSLLFGLAHGQLNVGIDVFVLSLVLCSLRSLTGSIWAGVLVHVIKNGLAYFLFFVAPLMGL
ncbi:MAG: type II CAAX endopeptidase family protein [Candidatus Saccharimonadales bacterium]